MSDEVPEYFYKQKNDTLYFCGLADIKTLKLILNNADKDGCKYFQFLFGYNNEKYTQKENKLDDPINLNHEYLYFAVRRGVAHAIWDIAATSKKLNIEDEFFDALKENINEKLKTVERKPDYFKEKVEKDITNILDQVTEILHRMSNNETQPKD